MFIGVILSNVTCWWNHVRVIVFIYSDILLENRYAFHLLLEMILKSKLTINWGIIDRPLLSITSCRNGCCWGVTISVDRNYTCGCWSCLRIEIFLKKVFSKILSMDFLTLQNNLPFRTDAEFKASGWIDPSILGWIQCSNLEPKTKGKKYMAHMKQTIKILSMFVARYQHPFNIIEILISKLVWYS